MVIKTYLDKATTIYEGSKLNFGLNPILSLNRGKVNSKGIIHFDINKLKNIFNDKEHNEFKDLRHTLKLYNCGSLDAKRFHNLIYGQDGISDRATSFTVLLFKLPCHWDRGVGFDKETDQWFSGKGALSEQGSNWYNATTEIAWPFEGIYWDYNRLAGAKTGIVKDEGDYESFDEIFGEYDDVPVLSGGKLIESGYTDYTSISAEYNKYLNGEDSIIIGSQHFDYGNENLSIDITDYVNKLIDDEDINFGIGICFAPSNENLVKITQYVGFFTDKTNTYYEPYLETYYDSHVEDTRGSFNLGENNKLYLCPKLSGKPINLDNLPTCTIEGEEYPVTQQSYGVYYATVNLPNSSKYKDNMILTDVWSNISIDGKTLQDIEMEFTINNPLSFSLNEDTETNEDGLYLIPSGIKADERLQRGEVRKVSITMKKPYHSGIICPLQPLLFKLYILDGERVFDATPWDYADSYGDSVSFDVDTNNLLPQEYHISIKYGDMVFDDLLRFKVVNNISNEGR